MATKTTASRTQKKAKTAARNVRNIRWYLHRALGGVLPRISMLSDDRIGILTKSVMSDIAGRSVDLDFPADMKPLKDSVIRICHLKPDSVVPIWVYLHPQCVASAPIVFAMDDAAAGAMIRGYIDAIMAGDGSFAFAAHVPEASAIREHAEQILKWFASEPSAEIRQAYQEATDTSEHLAAVLGLEGEDKDAALQSIGARLARLPEVTRNRKESMLADIAEDLHNGEEWTDDDIREMYDEAKAEDTQARIDEESAEDEDEDSDTDEDSEDEDEDGDTDEDDAPMDVSLF